MRSARAAMATLLSMACPCASGPLNSDDPREGELISKAIDTLTWESMNGSRSGPSPGSDEAKYLQGLGTRASAQLVDVLEDPDRGVAAHVVLSLELLPYLSRGLFLRFERVHFRLDKRV